MLDAAGLEVQERVEKAGGQVLYWNGHRVMGVLAMSRAIGDHGWVGAEEDHVF